jgi:hypothetical protein
VRFEDLKAVNGIDIVFWAVEQCGLIQRYQRFEEICCLHLQGRRIIRVSKNFDTVMKERGMVLSLPISVTLFYLYDGGSMFLRNVINDLREYTASLSRQQ